ncbi:hypothetical protein WEH80_32455 [Actinomycetes bacterium KLBMP 9759]
MSAVLASVRTWHRPLMIMVAAMAAMVVVAGVGMLVDGRELVDGSVWAKPFKFSVSFVIYGATLAWMLSQVRKAPRTMWTLGTAFAVTGFVDVGFIVLQAARGTYSHFSTAPDPINVIGQQIFQSGVIGLFGVSMVLAVMLLFQRVTDSAMTWALRAGIGLAALGMGVAFYIVGATTTDTHDVPDAYGNTVTLAGQHGIGVPEGHGMPITNWSVQGGDLRVPHFIGLHAVQIYIAAALVLAALATRVVWLRSARVRAQLTGVVILGYTGLFAITTWQAMRGQSLIHPDGATWTAVGVLVLVTAAVAALVIASARRAAARGTVEQPRELDTVGV